jgi:hypothetical protein
VGTPTFFLDGEHFWDRPDFMTLARAIEARLALQATLSRVEPERV